MKRAVVAKVMIILTVVIIISTMIILYMIMIILSSTIDRVMSIGRSIRIMIPAAFSDTQSSPPPLTSGPDLKKV